jgi:hypothetical protein
MISCREGSSSSRIDRLIADLTVLVDCSGRRFWSTAQLRDRPIGWSRALEGLLFRRYGGIEFVSNRSLEVSIRSNRGWRVPIDGSVKRSTEWMEQSFGGLAF